MNRARTIIGLRKSIITFIFDKKDMTLRFFLYYLCAMLFLPSCKNEVVSYKKQLYAYGDSSDIRTLVASHTIHFSLPSKYINLGDKRVPYLYSDHSLFFYSSRHMRENIYIADTLRYNWFYYDYASKASDTIDISVFTEMSLYQMDCTECTGRVYNVIEKKLENGNEKHVFISFCPSQIGWYGYRPINRNDDIGVDLHIDCFLKTADGYYMTFSIRSFEPLAEFNFQEKMDIINSIYVE